MTEECSLLLSSNQSPETGSCFLHQKILGDYLGENVVETHCDYDNLNLLDRLPIGT